MVSKVAPDWDLWRTLYRLSYLAAAAQINIVRLKEKYQIAEASGDAVGGHEPEGEESEEDPDVADQVWHEQVDVAGLEAVGQIRLGLRVGHRGLWGLWKQKSTVLTTEMKHACSNEAKLLIHNLTPKGNKYVPFQL